MYIFNFIFHLAFISSYISVFFISVLNHIFQQHFYNHNIILRIIYSITRSLDSLVIDSLMQTCLIDNIITYYKDKEMIDLSLVKYILLILFNISLFNGMHIIILLYLDDLITFLLQTSSLKSFVQNIHPLICNKHAYYDLLNVVFETADQDQINEILPENHICVMFFVKPVKLE